MSERIYGVTAWELNGIMEFDSVIEVHSDRSVTKRDDVYAPEATVVLDADGQLTDEFEIALIRELSEATGWDLMSGYTGQYGYRGPIMHPSEFVGGAMARDIMDTPGVYVAIIITGIRADDEIEDVGWAVAKRLAS